MSCEEKQVRLTGTGRPSTFDSRTAESCQQVLGETSRDVCSSSDQLRVPRLPIAERIEAMTSPTSLGIIGKDEVLTEVVSGLITYMRWHLAGDPTLSTAAGPLCEVCGFIGKDGLRHGVQHGFGIGA